MRVFRAVALPAPSDREKAHLYAQRYIQHFPATGEVVFFNRSWYNRAGVEYLMGFYRKDQYQAFVENCPRFENHIVHAGIIPIKFPYQKVKLPKRSTEGEYDDQATLKGRMFVPERY